MKMRLAGATASEILLSLLFNSARVNSFDAIKLKFVKYMVVFLLPLIFVFFFTKGQ